MPIQYIPSPLASYDLPPASKIRSVVGKRIRQKRLALRMSQIEVARNLGYESATFIALIEGAKRNISSAELARLAAHFKVELSYFYP